jgi:hypothetical protein
MQTPLGAVGQPVVPREGWDADEVPVFIFVKGGEYHVYTESYMSDAYTYVGALGTPAPQLKEGWSIDLANYVGWTLFARAVSYGHAHERPVIVLNGVVLGQAV